MKKRYLFTVLGSIGLILVNFLPANAEKVNTHGFIAQGYLYTDKNNYLAETEDKGSFQFNEMGISFTTFATERLKLGCQFYARDLGDVGNDEIKLNWAFSEYTFRNWLGLKVGIIKIPLGFYNTLRDFESSRTSIFLPASVYNEWLRDGMDNLKGVELFGSLSLGILGLVEYKAQIGMLETEVDSGIARFALEVRGGLESIYGFTDYMSYDGQLIWSTPLDGLRMGVTLYYGGIKIQGKIDAETDMTIDNKVSKGTVSSIEYIYNNFRITAESLFLLNKSDITFSNSDLKIKDTQENGDAYYVNIAYRFSDLIETSYYYSKYVDNKYAKGDGNKLYDNCISLRLDINYNWIAKLDYHAMEGYFGAELGDSDEFEEKWMLLAVKLSYSF